MRIPKQRRGQFIIIAALFLATMMISISTIMYSAVTYYKQERWEEYLTIIDNLKMGSRRVVEISLANHTSTMNDEILKSNINQWMNDIKEAHPGLGVTLSYQDEDGFNLNWYEQESFSSINTTFYINIISIGLRGYVFAAPVRLRVQILDAIWDSQDEILTISLNVDKEDSAPITNLEKSSFSVLIDDVELDDFTLSHYYNETYSSFIYEIECSAQPPQPSLVSMTIVDTRGIKVVANSTTTAS